jgi:hypothetical protein
METPAAFGEFLPAVPSAVEDERMKVDLAPDRVPQDKPRRQAGPRVWGVRVADRCQSRGRTLAI